MTSKICTKCKKRKPLSNYYFRNKVKGTYRPSCKLCDMAYHKKYYQENKQRYAAWWRKNKYNPERLEARRKTSKKWKQNNPEKVLLQARKDARKRRVFMNKLKDFPCIACGQKFPSECMDFDHIVFGGKKIKNLGKMFTHSKEKILKEIKKCDLVCSNCHRIRTQKRRSIKSDELPT